MIKTKTYENGLKLIVETLEDFRSVAVGIMVGAGSSRETAEENGISHFIEHVNFKGTATRTAFDISDELEGVGAIVNAYTAKDMTCYYVKCTDERVKQSFAVLSDIFLNSTYPEEELDKERGVVIEEINMIEDTPDELCIDALAEAYFGKSGYGATILGPVENAARFKKSDVLAYKNKHYTPDNIVVSFAGNISFEAAEELMNEYFGGFLSGAPAGKSGLYTPEISQKWGRVAIEKPIEQAHIAIGVPAAKSGDDDKYPLLLVNSVLGGGMSSRLFQSVREKSGLAYTVYSYVSLYKEVGVTYLYAAVNAKKSHAAYQKLLDEMRLLSEKGITAKELERAKEQIKGSTILSGESTSSYMTSNGKRLLLFNQIFNVDDELKKISAVTLDKANEVAAKYFSPEKRAAAIVGKNVKPLD